MPVYDLYSKRQKRLRGDIPDVFTYKDIPKTLRIQIIHIWSDVLGTSEQYYSINLLDRTNTYPEVVETYDHIVSVLNREYGTLSLAKTTPMTGHRKGYEELINYFLTEQNVEKVLSTIELSFQTIEESVRYSKQREDCLSELNQRFKEHGVGYEFIDSEIIRKDSEFIHSEVVKPALKLLNSKDYSGPQQEFLDAFDHYKKGKSKEAMNEALKAFESTMKAICDKHSWTYDSTKDTSNTLIDICYKNGLLPYFWQDHMKALRKLLESGVPTGRNKMSGHGQGATPKEVPDYIASYILHMTASAIVFLVNAEHAIK